MYDDEQFLVDFQDCQLPINQWHHREHVKLAYLYLRRHSFDQALCRIREGIKAYNAAHQIPSSPTSGYHETMTQAWLHLVQFALKQYGASENADAFCDDHPELSQKKTLRLFYSPERFMSAEAKTSFVEPDLTPFPVARAEKMKR
ncbi:MAG: hypothetical protein AAGA03_02145 [Planctomycetota bacterium]